MRLIKKICDLYLAVFLMGMWFYAIPIGYVVGKYTDGSTFMETWDSYWYIVSYLVNDK